MTVEQLEKELKNEKLQSLYLLYGEERFLLENSLKKIKNLFGECIKGINFIAIDDQNITNLIADMETPSFGYEKKLIIAQNTGIFKKEGKRKNGEITKLKEKLGQYIVENKKMIDENMVLVMVEEEVDKENLYKIFDQNGIVCKFDFQKPDQIAQRIKAICNAYQVKIDVTTMQYFIECCGTNMQELINEIRKLIEYVGKGGTIEKQNIDQLATKKLESVIFDLTDSLGKRQIKKSLEVLHNLLYAKEPIQKILITLYNHFKKIYFTKIALKENKDIIITLKLKPNQTFLVNKYKIQANSFQEKELRKMIEKLIDLDERFKSGKIDLQMGLESILCQYCS